MSELFSRVALIGLGLIGLVGLDPNTRKSRIDVFDQILLHVDLQFENEKGGRPCAHRLAKTQIFQPTSSIGSLVISIRSRCSISASTAPVGVIRPL